MFHASRLLMARLQQSSGRPAQGSAAGWAVFPVHSILPSAATSQPFQIRGLQTFLPYPDFAASIKCLDTKRLGKQRVEAYQILNIVTGKATSKAWQNHPCVRMWRGHTKALYLYYNQCLQEWSERGGNNVLLKPATLDGDIEMPPWLGNDMIHKSHRSMLLAKDAEHYGQFGWQDTPGSPYWWPVPMERKEEPMPGELKPRRKRATRAVGGTQDVEDVEPAAAERTAREKASREERALARQQRRQKLVSSAGLLAVVEQAGHASRVESSISVAVESIANLPSAQEGPSIRSQQSSATGQPVVGKSSARTQRTKRSKPVQKDGAE